MNAEMKWNRDRRNAGYVAELALRILLLGLVLGQVVFLAGRMRMRVDVTADALFTLTGTSKSLLGGLDDQLRIECYFCSDDAVPAMYGDSRKTLKNVLDEYVQSGGGRVLVTYHDPLEDKTTKEKATNLRMQPQTLEDPSRGALALKEVWQGMRIMYGADKQKVIPFLGFSEVTFAYEKVLTPMIKELTVAV
ncbi:MAG: Gldg family protein, partial [Planctomycetota bacterium]|nr:Gldg family protein [Planctomycetota bacterium]